MRHVCGISGGKDSSALAVYLGQVKPELEVEYFFCDTGAELPETYEYLTRLETVLGKPIARLNAERGFDHWFEVYRGMLPSPQVRWCTRMMKIAPLEAWIGDEPTTSYVAIRADESSRKGYVSTKPNIVSLFPFIEDNIDHEGVLRILDDAGIGLPSYYEWRTRSGCYFCFYQSGIPNYLNGQWQLRTKCFFSLGPMATRTFQQRRCRAACIRGHKAKLWCSCDRDPLKSRCVTKRHSSEQSGTEGTCHSLRSFLMP